MASITKTKAVNLVVNKIDKTNFDSMRTAGTITDAMAADELWMGDGRLVSDSDLTAHTGDSNIHTTAAEKAKLSGIAAGANNYTHPSSHPPSIITQDASNRFVTDTEKATWNAKETTAGSQAKVDAHIAVKTNPHGVTKAQVGLGSVNDYDIATQAEAEAGTSNVKYMTPLSTKQAITKAAPVNATTSVSGLMSNTDKAKLDGVATGANNYIHPATDGDLHVPATGTTNSGKVLKAGSTAGSLSWGTLTAADVGAAPTSHTHSYVPTDRTVNGKALSADITLSATDVSAYSKAEIDNKEFVYGDPVATFENFDPINAQFLGGNAPEYYAVKTQVDSAIGQITHDKTQISNPNLLINGDFQVWQRGTSFISTSYVRAFTADRWDIGIETGVEFYVARAANGILAQKLTNNKRCWMAQRIELNPSLVGSLRGKIVTLSFETVSNNGLTAYCGYSRNLTVETEKISSYTISTNWERKAFTFQMPTLADSDTHFTIVPFRVDDTCKDTIVSGDFVHFRKIKLELGDIATPFSPRTYAEELSMCQRYFQLIPRIRIKTDRAPLDQKAPYSLPVVMRTTPTISYTGGDSIAFIETDYCENHISLSIMTTNTLIDRTFTNVKLDAEIY